MLLAVSNSRDETVDYLLRRFDTASIPYIRLDSDTLHDRARIEYGSDGPYLIYDGRPYFPSQFAQVWLRRPERLRVSIGHDDAEREHTRLEWTEAVEGFLTQIPPTRWINHPTANSVAAHKLDQLSRAEVLGLDIPPTLVTQDVDKAREFARRHKYEIIAKPLASGYLERQNGNDSLIYTSAVSEQDLIDSGSWWGCPTLFQKRIKKTTDIRATILDQTILAYAIDRKTPDGAQQLDVRTDNMSNASYRQVAVPQAIRDRLLALIAAYRLRFAAVDFVVDDRGRWIFLEINPNGQWAWLDLFGGAEIWRLFVDAVRRPTDSVVSELSLVDSATWLALRACRIDVTREQVRLRRYHGQFVPQIRPEEAGETKELLDYAIATFERANERRKSIDEKAKLLGGFVTFAITVCAAMSSKFATPLAMMPSLVFFVLSLLLLLSYFRLGVAAQPSVTAKEAQQAPEALIKQLVSDYLASAEHNECGTSFGADVFRAAVVAFVAGILMLSIPLIVMA